MEAKQVFLARVKKKAKRTSSSESDPISVLIQHLERKFTDSFFKSSKE